MSTASLKDIDAIFKAGYRSIVEEIAARPPAPRNLMTTVLGINVYADPSVPKGEVRMMMEFGPKCTLRRAVAIAPPSTEDP